MDRQDRVQRRCGLPRLEAHARHGFAARYRDLVEELGEQLKEVDATKVETVVLPPFVDLRTVQVAVDAGADHVHVADARCTAAQARQALADAWQTEPVDIGIGGSIPFVASFAERFPNAAILITGIEDPDTRAHSANESLYVPDFRRAIEAQALFLARMNENGSGSEAAGE